MIAIGSDHAGYDAKTQICAYLSEKNIEFTDFGTFSADSCDYPVYARKVANEVASGTANSGILICGSGIGMAIAANKVVGVRCAVCQDGTDAELARSHNDANVIALAARKTSLAEMQRILDIWLNTEFIGGRHQRRVDMIDI